MLLFVLLVLTARLCGQHTPVIPESIEQFIEEKVPVSSSLPSALSRLSLRLAAPLVGSAHRQAVRATHTC
jgi:hypothetical protein